MWTILHTTFFRFFLPAFLCLAAPAATAQLIDLEWVKTINGVRADNVGQPALYSNGDIVITGSFTGACDFDPGPATVVLTAQLQEGDMFVARYNKNGGLVWVKQVTGARGVGVTLDIAGNAYIAGNFFGTTDFDPGPAVYNLSSTGNDDMFIARLNAAGAFVWAKQIGTAAGNINPHQLIADPNGNIYIGGTIWGQIDIDPGPGQFLLSSPSLSVQNGYILKLDANGGFQWAFPISSAHLASGSCITKDKDNNVLLAGFFSGTYDFDPGPAVFNMTSTGNLPMNGDMFILKLSPAGNFIWAKQISGIGGEVPYSITTDNDNNVYSTGYFSAASLTSTVDFDPGPGSAPLSCQPATTAIFISKLTGSGDFVWARHFRSSSSAIGVMNGSSIVADEEQHVFVSGIFYSTIDVDPGPGTTNITTAGNDDHLLAVLKPDGSLLSVETMGGPDHEATSFLLQDPDGAVYFIGEYNPGATFAPCHGISIGNAGSLDIFIAKYVRPLISITASATSLCTGTAATFTATLKNEGSSYTIQWMVNGVNVGSNSSTYSAPSFNDNDVVTAVLIRHTNCPVPATDTSNKVILQVGTAVTPAVQISTQYSNTCAGMPVTFTATVSNEGNNPQFQWLINGNNAGSNEASFTTTSLQDNDRVELRLTSDAGCATPPVVLSNSIVMHVSDPPLPVISISYPPGNICSGQAVPFSATVQNAGPSLSYQWTLNGMNTGINSSSYALLNPVQGDVVQCIITTKRSCSPLDVLINSNQIILPTVYPVPDVTLTPANATLLIGESLQLSGTITGNFDAFVWQPSGSLNNSQLLNPVVTPVATTTYLLRVSTTAGCIIEKKAEVKVVQKLFMPNSFTPNNDGRNDIFRIPPTSDILLQQFRIYDRFGSLVFHTTDMNRGWDGTYKGMPLSHGNYVYMVKGTDRLGHPVWQQGNILLIR